MPPRKANPHLLPVGRRFVLDPKPESVGEARRLVADVLAERAGDDAVDVATLLVSELVTNAVLHAATPIELSCELDRSGVYVSVRDESPAMPGRRHYDDDALTGRGLEMVELLADTWGVEPDGTGKAVWFRLTGGADANETPADWDTSSDREDTGFMVSLLNTPTALLLATVQYGDSVLRELALTSFADETGARRRWEAPSVDLGRVLDAAAQAREDGTDRLDLRVGFPVGAGGAASERLSLIEEADDMARQGLLLSRPAPPEIGRCRHWLLSQIAQQEEGHPAVPWDMPAD